MRKENPMLKMAGHSIVFQEVPDEISLAIEITGCRHHCEGCHSQHLWEDTGEPVMNVLPLLLENYKGLITCVCFMGGDHDQQCLTDIADYVRNRGLKTCLYTGLDSVTDLHSHLLTHLNYAKVGRWNALRGPLSDPNTNQRFYKLQTILNSDGSLTLITTDYTDKFRRKEL